MWVGDGEWVEDVGVKVEIEGGEVGKGVYDLVSVVEVELGVEVGVEECT